MISEREAVNKYRESMRVAVQWHRRGRPEVARAFWYRASGIASVIGYNRHRAARRTLVGRIIGVFE